jgi:aspartate 1-decarboxylase
MLLTVLKSKISYAIITDSSLFYEGSLGMDLDIMDEAGIKENEQIHVVNVNNGERLITYAIAEKRGSKAFVLNGPAARKGLIGDKIIVLAYAQIMADEQFQPKLVKLAYD